MSKRRTNKGTAETPPLLATENSLPPLPPIRASTEVLGTTSTVAQPNVRVVPLPRLVDSARSTHIAGAIRPPPSRGTVHRRPLVAVLEGAASERCAAQRALLRAKSSTVSCYTTLQNRELWLGADNVPNGAVVDGGQWSTDNEYRSAKLRCKVLALPPLPELGSDDDMDWATSDSDRDTSPTRRNNFLGVYLTEFERIGGVASAPPATTHRTPQQQSTKKKTKKTRDASPRGPPRCATVMTASYRASLSPAASPRAFARAQDDEEDELTLMRRKLEEGRHSHEGYISHCLAALRKQPATFAVFEKLCDEARIKATMVSAGGTNFLKRNVSGVQSHTVHAVSERRQTRAVERQKHAVHIKEAHEAKVAEFVQHAANGDDERRAARRLRSQMAWLPLMFFAARSQWLMNVVNRKRRAEEAVAQSAACVVIQRSYRRCRYGIRAMSVPRAFVIRACFLRRVLNVRVRPKLRHLYVARIAHLLRKIVTTAPLLPTFVSIKLFGRRVLIAQRQCRRRAAQRKAVTIAREVQWATACDARSGELQSVIRRGKSPGAEAIAVTDAFAATEEIRILSALPNSVRDEVLRDYETDYRAKYNAQLATWRARKAALANGNRSALSPHPPRHHVAVPGLVMTTLISQAVRIVKSAVVPRS